MNHMPHDFEDLFVRLLTACKTWNEREILRQSKDVLRNHWDNLYAPVTSQIISNYEKAVS